MLPRIKLERVNVHLAGRHVLKDVSWTLAGDAHWAFVGANGSGKSTLLRVIAATQWIDYDGGRRSFSPDGIQRDAASRAATWIRHVSAEQHERYARLDLGLAGRAVIESGFDNSLYVQRTLRPDENERVEALIERFDLNAFARRPVRELSTGQLRRLLIARALVREPRVLVLDEFTSGLDGAARRSVLAFLDRISASVSLVIASHRNDDFPVALTHTARVRDGRIDVAERKAALPAAARIRPLAPAAPAVGPVLLDIRCADVYRGETLVLRDINWQLRQGEHTALRGANGSGKSTFAGLIAGTVSAATGAQIVRFGQSGPFDIWKLKQRVVHLSDDLQIAYDRRDTVEAAIASGFAASIGLFFEPSAAQRRRVDDVVQQLGLDRLSGRNFATLSFGERRKVLIARSLVRRPAILILDEIWNGLDAEFRRALRELLAALAASGTTLVAVTHDAEDDVVSLTSRVCTVAGGRVSETARRFNAGIAP